MPKYKDPTTGAIITVGNPDLNPDLIAGKTLVTDETDTVAPGGTIPGTTITTPTPGVISGDTLADNGGVDFETGSSSTVDVNGLLTPTQQEIQDEMDRLRALNEASGGESAFTTEQEEAQNIAGLTQIQQEQATLVQNLQLEAQALANEYAGVEDVMQAGAEGRGITAGGLRPLTAGQQRLIAIKQRQVASRALTAYAAFNVAKGNLQVAQDAVDKAVAAKFDPIKEDIEIKTKNLELLMASPLLTAEENAQAKAELENQKAEEKKVAKQEENYTAIANLYVQVAAMSGVDPATVKKIKDIMAKDELTVDDVAEVNRLATEAGLFEEEITPIDVTATPDKPLTINQVEQFRRSYGWTPPLGYTQNQLIQYMNDNPDATPEELEAGINQLEEEGTETTPTGDVFTEEYFRANYSTKQLKAIADKAGASRWYTGKETDITRFFNEYLADKVAQAKEAGWSDDEILKFLTE